jgi:ubiquitin C-terminal hydrolase
MAQLEEYSSAEVPNLFALGNNGSLCYLNALVQSLMSCSSFNRHLNRLVKRGEDNPVIQEYLKLYRRNLGTPSVCPVRQDSAVSLFNLICRHRGRRLYNLTPGAQEDIQEGLILLLETINDKADSLFYVRYQLEIVCLRCKTARFQEKEDGPELYIDLSETNPETEESLINKENVEKYIMCNQQTAPDYRCEKCGACNKIDETTGRMSENVVQIYRLKRLSNIIVILFKKYIHKKVCYFPPCLDIPFEHGTLHYQVVAQVEHYGTARGGHYVCKALRRKPEQMHSKRRLAAQRALDHNRNLLETTILTSEHRQELIKKNHYYQEIICRDHLLETDSPLGVFLLNDDSVRFSEAGFSPTADTYMVFYHLQEKR